MKGETGTSVGLKKRRWQGEEGSPQLGFCCCYKAGLIQGLSEIEGADALRGDSASCGTNRSALLVLMFLHINKAGTEHQLVLWCPEVSVFAALVC